jgi:hypothetical protein
LWFLVLVVDNENDWQSLVEELKSRRKRVGYGREDAEAKLSQIACLQQRLDSLKLNAVELFDDQEIDKKSLRKARTKVFEQTVSERDKTPAMKNTPRRLLSARALRGHWDRFPVSPARFEPAFLLEINKSKFYYKRATFPLSNRIGQILKREEDRSDTSAATKLALYRAFLTSMIGAMEKVDDSFGVIGDLYQIHLPTYLGIPFIETGIAPIDYYRDFLEFAVWEIYGLMDSNLDPWFASIETNHIALVESILRDIISELSLYEFEYHIEQALGLLARLFIQQKLSEKFVSLAREMGSRAWEPILTMAEAAWKAGKHKVAVAVFSAADQPGFHQEYLREECVKMTGRLPPKKPYLTVVR